MIERSLLIDKSQDQTPGVKKYTINGYQDESLIVRANRYFRYIPKNIMKIVPGHLFVWDYLYQPFMHIFNRNDETKSGWNIIDGKMVIGNGETYDDEIESTISFFLEIPSTLNPRLKIKALLDSEKNCDFLSVSVGKIQGNQERLYTISGRNVTIEKEFELKRFAGIGRVEVQVSFTSDEMIHHGQIRLLDLVFVS